MLYCISYNAKTVTCPSLLSPLTIHSNNNRFCTKINLLPFLTNAYVRILDFQMLDFPLSSCISVFVISAMDVLDTLSLAGTSQDFFTAFVLPPFFSSSAVLSTPTSLALLTLYGTSLQDLEYRGHNMDKLCASLLFQPSLRLYSDPHMSGSVAGGVRYKSR